MSHDILVIVEQWKGQIDGITYQLLAKGAQLADSQGVGLSALIVGHQLDKPVEVLKDKGMDTLLVIDNPDLGQAGADVCAAVIAEAVRQVDAGLVLVGYSLVGMELAPPIAGRLGVTLMTNCVNVEIFDGEFIVTRPLFDGTVHARIALEGKGLAVVALQRGPTPTVQLPSKNASVQSITVDIQSIPVRSKVLELIEAPASEVDITKADILVSIGRGIGDKEKMPVIEGLAQALGGLIACSRPLVDLGFLPSERQVGASGKIVAPKVYIACGISGASQHLTGMSDSKIIVAINKDPNAPIYQVAHYGVVADLFEIVPALTEAAKKGKTAAVS
ncbi:MAG: electron transfer flavoprotein subunit alpha/FixB family protein [Pseudomonadota bacterium]